MRATATTILLAAALLSGCAGDEAEFRQSFPALGTIITVEIRDADQHRAETAMATIERDLARIGRDWYAWGAGELGQLNELLAQGKSARVSPELATLLVRALEVRVTSDGFFDPTVGMLVEAWGFHDASAPPVAPPDEAWLAEWRASAAGRQRLRVADDIVIAAGPVKIALGGIAKGSVLARAMDVMHDLGIENALVDAGGDLQVTGTKNGRGWRIGIRDPRSSGIIGIVELSPGEAVLSSGDYERFVERDGQRAHHLLDPHTGRPVEHTMAVTVIHEDAELADAAATALMAAGPDRFDALAARLGIRIALLVNSDGDVIMTPAMAARLEPNEHNSVAEGSAAKM
ncbi:MAG: FAD:protein FMN transferase [Gammaproteobacteria bacterium]|nr:FAD:protein FMN transferase [Gammaproteobacteria bacterium]MBT8443394.1 FAD:protein FMN transferase [Gammaproteobacteria bacterium]NND37947.1 FAD:protein FMN transferase [Gammaproteobacteria bacterium]